MQSERSSVLPIRNCLSRFLVNTSPTSCTYKKMRTPMQRKRSYEGIGTYHALHSEYYGHFELLISIFPKNGDRLFRSLLIFFLFGDRFPFLSSHFFFLFVLGFQFLLLFIIIGLDIAKYCEMYYPVSFLSRNYLLDGNLNTGALKKQP